MKGLYIHIPFCHQICHYCDFNKVFFKNQPVDAYIESIGKELSLMVQSGISFERLETIFLGGGTPTSLSENQLDRLLEIIHQSVDISKIKEFSTEANPDELTIPKMEVLKNGGVNRLSIGVQSFDEELLIKLGRTHSPTHAVKVVDDARSVGFNNISIDLMYGLPGQTLTQWEDTLTKAFKLDLPHYSAYSLIVEPKTVFYNLMNKGKLPLPGEDLEGEMFSVLMEQMINNGIHQYEISNFGKLGHESLHNIIYWENETYGGVGAGAHGYVDGVRYSNIGPLNRYMEKLETGERPLQSKHVVTEQEAMEEEMFLGLRLLKGVSEEKFEQKFKTSLQDVYHEPLQKLIAKELLQYSNQHYKLTKYGIFRGNEVFQEFLK